jgi:four helix bundle protein
MTRRGAEKRDRKTGKKTIRMNDRLNEIVFYQLSLELWDLCWVDTETLSKDFRGKEIGRQLIRSVGSISANIEEGYGRGFGKEYPQFLRIARGSARESKGWYRKSNFLLSEKIIEERTEKLDFIIAMLTRSIQTLENKKVGENRNDEGKRIYPRPLSSPDPRPF